MPKPARGKSLWKKADVATVASVGDSASSSSATTTGEKKKRRSLRNRLSFNGLRSKTSPQPPGEQPAAKGTGPSPTAGKEGNKGTPPMSHEGARGDTTEGTPGSAEGAAAAARYLPGTPSSGGKVEPEIRPVQQENGAAMNKHHDADHDEPRAEGASDTVLSFEGAVQAVVAAQDALDQIHPHGSPAVPKRVLGRMEAERMRLIEQELAEAKEKKELITDTRQTTLLIHKVLGRPMLGSLHFDRLVTVGIVLYLLFCAVLVKLFDPSLFWMVVSAVAFLPVGVALNFLFIGNSCLKEETRGQVHLDPGRRGMEELMHHVPTWVYDQKNEKVQWLNKILTKAWPYYDKAICNAIKEEVGPMIALYKPSFIKYIGFEKLTFGESPFKIDTILTDRETEGQLVMEVAFRWQGDANISLGIMLAGLGALAGDASKMVVKLSKLQLSGVLRIAMMPLVDVIPGFGAITAALTKSPIIKYHLDFGKALGSSFSAGLVRAWLDPFIKNTLVELLVWPERIVVPMMPESVTGNLDYLNKQNVGILQVTVVKGRDLKPMDVGKNATSDPFICLWSNPNRKMDTKVVKKTLEPEWEETFHVLVQEPTTQDLKVELYDWDGISMTELFSSFNMVNNLRNATGGRQFMGRCLIPVKPYTLVPGEEVEEEFDMGLQDWSSIGGPGKGEGKLSLRFCYHPMAACRGMAFKTGAVSIRVLKIHGLAQLGIVRPMPLYIKLKMRDAKKKLYSKDITMLPPRVDPKTGKQVIVDPEWNQLFEFFEIGKRDILEILVREKDSASDEDQGSLIISLEDVVIPKPNSTITEWFELENTLLRPGKTAKIQLKIEWCGFIPEDDEFLDVQAKASPPRPAATKPRTKQSSARKAGNNGTSSSAAAAEAPARTESCGKVSVFGSRAKTGTLAMDSSPGRNTSAEAGRSSRRKSSLLSKGPSTTLLDSPPAKPSAAARPSSAMKPPAHPPTSKRNSLVVSPSNALDSESPVSKPRPSHNRTRSGSSSTGGGDSTDNTATSAVNPNAPGDSSSVRGAEEALSAANSRAKAADKLDDVVAGQKFNQSPATDKVPPAVAAVRSNTGRRLSGATKQASDDGSSAAEKTPSVKAPSARASPSDLYDAVATATDSFSAAADDKASTVSGTTTPSSNRKYTAVEE